MRRLLIVFLAMLCSVNLFSKASPKNNKLVHKNNQETTYLFNELMVAIQFNRKECALKAILDAIKAGLLKEVLMLKNQTGYTLLHTAIRNNNYSITRYIVSEVARRCWNEIFLDTCTNERFLGYNALHMAQDLGSQEISAIILQNVEKNLRQVLLRSQTADGSTILHIAAKKGHKSSLEYLLMLCGSTLTSQDTNQFLLEMLTCTDHSNLSIYDVAVAHGQTVCLHIIQHAFEKLEKNLKKRREASASLSMS